MSITLNLWKVPSAPPLPFLLQRFIHIVATVTFVHIPTSRESCLHSCVSVYTEEVYTYISICLAASLLQLRQGSPSRSGVACCGPLQVLFKVLFCVPPPLPHFLYLGTTIHPTPLPWPKATRSGGQVYKRGPTLNSTFAVPQPTLILGGSERERALERGRESVYRTVLYYTVPPHHHHWALFRHRKFPPLYLPPIYLPTYLHTYPPSQVVSASSGTIIDQSLVNQRIATKFTFD